MTTNALTIHFRLRAKRTLKERRKKLDKKKSNIISTAHFSREKHRFLFVDRYGASKEMSSTTRRN